MERGPCATAVREAWAEWIAGLRQWDWYGTLTLDPGRWAGRHRPGPDGVRRHVEAWAKVVGKRLGAEVVGVAAIEYHKSGWPHVHVLCDVQGEGLSGRVVATQEWFRRCGYALLEVPRSVEDCARYTAKYLAKEVPYGELLLLGRWVEPVKRQVIGGWKAWRT